jgi:hypothetical protein
VTPAVVAPWLASFPVMCGETEEDSRFARGKNDPSDNKPDHSAAMLSKQHGRVWELLPSVGTAQIRP